MNCLSFKKAFNVPRCDSEVTVGEEIYKIPSELLQEFFCWERDLVSCWVIHLLEIAFSYPLRGMINTPYCLIP